MEILDITYIQRKEDIIARAEKYAPVCNRFEMEQMVLSAEEQSHLQSGGLEKNVSAKVMALATTKNASYVFNKTYENLDRKLHKLKTVALTE